MGILLHDIIFAVGAPLAAGLIAMVAGGEQNKPKRRLGPRFGMSDTFDLIRATTAGDITVVEEEPAQHSAYGADQAELAALVAHIARLEAKILHLESSGMGTAATDSAAEALAVRELDRRVREQQTELDRMRESLNAAERRSSTTADLLDRRVRQLREDMPVLVETNMSSQVLDMQARFEAEAEETRLNTVATFEAMVEEKLSDRISLIERSMAEQSAAVNLLRERAMSTDSQLQRLIGAIEKMFDPGASQSAGWTNGLRAEPVPRQDSGIRLEQAIAAASDNSIQRPQPEPSTLGDPEASLLPPPDFRNRIMLQPETDGNRKPRAPMSPMI